MTATKRAVASNELTMALSPLEVNARIVQIRNLIISGCPRTRANALSQHSSVLAALSFRSAAEQFRRYGTSGLMPGVRRVRTSSSATRISLMLLSWETRRITLKAWSASIL